MDRELPSQKVTLESATEGAVIWFVLAAPHESVHQMPVVLGGLNEQAQPNVYDPNFPPSLDSETPGVWTVYAVAFKAGFVLSEVITSKTVVDKVKMPGISVVNGKEFSRSVKLYCGTPAAKVMFSISEVDTVVTAEDGDGSPTISWKEAEFVEYVPGNEETVLPRTQTEQLLCRAQAFKAGLAHSGVCEFIIFPTSQCEAPTIVRLLPTYALAIDSSTSACHIFYNIDSNAPPYPGVNSARYSSDSKPMLPAVAGIHVVQAVAVKSGAAMSSVARVEVTVEKVVRPIIDVQPVDEANGSTPVMISSVDTLAKLYYTIDGTAPNPTDAGMASSYGSNQGTEQVSGSNAPLALYPNRRSAGTILLKVVATKVGCVCSDVVQATVSVPVDTTPVAEVAEPAAVEIKPVLAPKVEAAAPTPVPKVVIPTKVGLTVSLNQATLKVRIVNETHPDWKVYYTMGEAHKMTTPSPTNEQALVYVGEFDPAVRDAEGKFTPLVGKDAMSTKLCFAVRAIAISEAGARSRIVQKRYNFFNGFLTDLVEEAGMKFTIERKLRRVSMKGSVKHLGHRFSTGGVATLAKMDHQIVEESVNLEQSAAKRQMVLKEMRCHSLLLHLIADVVQTEDYFPDLAACAMLDEDHDAHGDLLDAVVESLIDEAAAWWSAYYKSLKWFLATKSWAKSKVQKVYLGKNCDEHTVHALAESLIAVEKHVQDVYLFDVDFTEPVVADLCRIIENYNFLQRVYISSERSKISAAAAKRLDAAASKGSVALAIKHESWKINLPVTAFQKLGLFGFQ